MNNNLLALMTILNFQNYQMNISYQEENVYVNQENNLKITTLECKEQVQSDWSYITYSEDWNSIKQITFSNGVICNISKIEEKLWFES
jgi:hypothetical protein